MKGNAPEGPKIDLLAKVRAEARKGSLVIIFLDAAAAYHFGCYGYDRDTSPNIDAFARDGVLFERAIVTFPNTAHSFWSVVTSRWSRPAETAAMPGLFKRGPPADPTNSTAALMKKKEYFTLAASANLFASQSWRGFDVVERIFPLPKNAHELSKGYRYRCPAFYPVVQGWLQKHQKGDKKLYLWLHYLEPHSPYNTPEPFASRFRAQTPAGIEPGPTAPAPQGPSDIERIRWRGLANHYDNNIAFVDHEIGRLFDLLKERGIYDSSTIVLTADHGEAWNEHGTHFHNTGVHDEEARVPLIIKFPKNARPRNWRVRAPVSAIDLMPTLADLYAIEVDTSRWSGMSLLPLAFTDRRKTHEYVFCRAGADPETAVWRDRLGLPLRKAAPAQRKDNNFYSIRDERYLLTWQVTTDEVQLYDTLLDPLERVDVGTKLPAVRDRMLRVLKEWRMEAPDFIRAQIKSSG